MDAVLAQILEQLKSLQSDVTSIKASQLQQGDMLAQLISIVGSTNQKVTGMQADIVELKEGQTRQDKILESLALRSLEQETDLRELKRAK
jgi:hypothetical protein